MFAPSFDDDVDAAMADEAEIDAERAAQAAADEAAAEDGSGNTKGSTGGDADDDGLVLLKSGGVRLQGKQPIN